LSEYVRSFEGRIKTFIVPIIKREKGTTVRVIGYIFASKVIAHIFSIISGIIIARHLGAEGKGILAALFVIPTFISSFGHLGLPISNIYFMGKKRDRETLLANSVYFILFASCSYIIISLFALPLLQKSYFSGIQSPYLIYLTLGMILLLLTKQFYVDFLRGLEKYTEFNHTNLLQHALRLSLIAVFAYLFNLTVGFAIIAMFISLVASNLYSYTVIRKEIPLRNQKVSAAQFRENLSFGLKEYLGNLFATLNVKIDLLILAAFMDKASIGIYSVAIALSTLFQFIPSSINVVLLPKISKSTGKNIQTILQRSIISDGVLLTLAWLSFTMVGKWLIQSVYGMEFSRAYYLSVIMLCGTILLSFTQILNKYFSGIGKPEIKSRIRAMNIPIKAISLYFLVKLYGLEGAAWSFLLTTVFLLVFTLYYYYRTKKVLTEILPSQEFEYAETADQEIAL